MDELDELFADPGPLQLSVPLPPGLVQCLNEASLNGCCQKVDWSKSGALAYISSDGYSVVLQHLLCDPQDGQWKLSQQYVIDDTYTAQQHVGLVHVSWDHAGNFLATIDAHGRTSIYATFFAINRMNTIRRCAFDPEDDLGAVMGLMWLHMDRPAKSFYYKPSIKTNGQWNFMCTPQKLAGPRNPLQKSSVVLVTRGGVIRVLYQDKDNRWQDIRADVQHVKDASGVLSHVAMCADRGDTAGPESKSRAPTQPFVLTAFSCFSHDFQGGDTANTILCKWELSSEKPALHPSFTQLASKRPNTSPNAELSAEYCVKKSPEIVVPRALISLHHINLSTVLAMMYSDGTIEFRDSQSLQLLPPDNETQISSLSQIGFAFPANTSCLRIALSPNSCAAFCMDENHFPSIRLMQYANPGTPIDEAFLEIVNEAFITQLSIASRAVAGCTEDVLSTAQLFASQYLNLQMQNFAPSLGNSSTFNRRLLSGIYRILGVSLDHAIDAQQDQSYKNAYFQRCLGVQASLGFLGEFTLRPTEGIIAVVMFSLRYFSIVLSYITTKKADGSESEFLKKPDIVSFLLPLVSWFLALENFIIDELCSILRTFEDAGIGQDHLDANLINQNICASQSPALPLLFISTCRSMFKYDCRSIRILAGEIDKHHDSTPLSGVYRELDMVMQKFPVSLHQFEKILNEVDNSVRAAYQSSAMGEADRKGAEKDMLTKAEISQTLIEPVKQLLFQTVTSLRNEINEAELYFMDVGDLGLTNDNISIKRSRKHPTDAMQKTPLRKDVKVRRCIRCGTFMEDVLPQRNGNPILGLLGRTCCCGSSWMVLEREEIVQPKV
ncbi:MAG: hypothetical protein Q9163_000911 [Psora crenata]